MKTGKLIEALMHYRHISLEEMSNATNIAQNNITTLLTCRRNITPFLAEKMCKVLDIEPIVIMTNRMCEELKNKELYLKDKQSILTCKKSHKRTK